MTRTSRRSFLNLLVAAAAAGPLLAACGPEAPPTATKPVGDARPAGEAKPTADTKPAADAKPAGTAPAKAAGGAELTYLNESRGAVKATTMLIEKYATGHGVKVTLDTTGPTDHLKKLQAASQAGNMPDMYSPINNEDMAPFYRANWAMNLEPELENGWKKNFISPIYALMHWRPDNPFGVAPGVYHVTWEIGTYAVAYNLNHFEKAKLDPKKPPTTGPELTDALKALKAAGIAGIALGDTTIPLFIQHHVSNWLTDEEIEATQAGKRPWKSDAYRKALQFFVDGRDGGHFLGNALSVSTPALEKSFFNVQELGILYMGAVSVPVQVTTAPEFTAYASFPMPKAADATSQPRMVIQRSKGAAINPKGKVVDETLKFTKWLTEKEQAAVFMEQVPLMSPNPEALDTTKLVPQLRGFAQGLDAAQRVYTSRIGPVNEAFVKGVQAMLLKEKTVDQVLDDVDKAQKGA